MADVVVYRGNNERWYIQFLNDDGSRATYPLVDLIERGHGTHAGYMRHYRRGEKACQECLTAHRSYSREVGRRLRARRKLRRAS